MLGLWLLCSAPSLLLRPSSESVFSLPLWLALVIGATGALSVLVQKLRGPLARYWRGFRWPLLESKPIRAFGQLGLLPSMLLYTGSPDHPHHSGLPHWGETLDWRYLLRILMLSYIAMIFLQSRDLHWRRLLAPGGIHRPSIGWRIFVSSWRGNLIIAALLTGLCCAVEAAISAYMGNFNLLASFQWPTSAAALASDLALATALAVVLRGNAGGQDTAAMSMLIYMVLVACICLAWRALNPGQEPTFTWKRDAIHALAMLATLLLFCPLMQRAWHRADLVQLLTQARAQAQAAEQN